MGRIEKITQTVVFELNRARAKDTPPVTLTALERAVILNHLNELERKIAEEALAFEHKQQLYLVPTLPTYTIDQEIFKIKEIEEPSTWNTRLTVIHDANRWVDIKNGTGTSGIDYVRDRDNLNVVLNLGTLTVSPVPLFIHVFGGQIEFYPAPTKMEAITLFLYLYPDELTLDDDDPNLPLAWDRCLRYGILADMLGGGWQTKFDHELADQKHQALKSTVKDAQVTESRYDKVGF